MSAVRLCVVCMERPRKGLLMCEPCGRSWDRDAAKDTTMRGAVVWAARRARRFEKRRGERREADLLRGMPPLDTDEGP